MKPLEFLPLLILRATFAVVMLLVLMALEYGVPIYVPLWIYALLIAFNYWVLWKLSSGPSRVRQFIFPALFTVGLLWLFADASDSSQSMMRHLHRVQPGMNVSQVEAIMGDYNHYNTLFGFQNTRRAPSGELVLIHPDYATYKHSTPDDGAYNAASGVVNFKDGKVTGVQYIGD